MIFAWTTILSSLSSLQPAHSAFRFDYIIIILRSPQGTRIETRFIFCFESARNFSFLSKLNRAAFGTNHTECDGGNEEEENVHSFDAQAKVCHFGMGGGLHTPTHNEVATERYMGAENVETFAIYLFW